jgi:hypothetical protein
LSDGLFPDVEIQVGAGCWHDDDGMNVNLRVIVERSLSDDVGNWGAFGAYAIPVPFCRVISKNPCFHGPNTLTFSFPSPLFLLTSSVHKTPDSLSCLLLPSWTGSRRVLTESYRLDEE